MSLNFTLADTMANSTASAGAMPMPAMKRVIESHQKSMSPAASAVPANTMNMRRAVDHGPMGT